MVKVHFKISASADSFITYNILKNLPVDPAGAQKRLKGRNIPTSLLENLSLLQVKKFLKTIYSKKYYLLQKTLKNTQDFWTIDKINYIASRLLELFKTHFEHPLYECIISMYFSTSAWEGNVFSIWYKKAGKSPVFAYEFIESYVHGCCRIHKSPLTEYQRWALSEAIAFNLIYIDKTSPLPKFWDYKITYEDANYYPQLKSFLPEVGKILFDKTLPKEKISNLIAITKKYFS